MCLCPVTSLPSTPPDVCLNRPERMIMSHCCNIHAWSVQARGKNKWSTNEYEVSTWFGRVELIVLVDLAWLIDLIELLRLIQTSELFGLDWIDWICWNGKRHLRIGIFLCLGLLWKRMLGFFVIGIFLWWRLFPSNTVWFQHGMASTRYGVNTLSLQRSNSYRFRKLLWFPGKFAWCPLISIQR